MDDLKGLSILTFTNSREWRDWLEKNQSNIDGVWLKLFKKSSGKQSFTYHQALDEALCFGWIDGIKKSFDDQAWLQKFTPRRKRSTWSKINRQHVARLVKEKKMTEFGLKEIERAKQDGRWDAAYDSPKNMKVPADFLTELKKDKMSYEFYKTLNKANTYAIAWRLRSAKKPETRERRMNVLLKMMKDHKKLH